MPSFKLKIVALLIVFDCLVFVLNSVLSSYFQPVAIVAPHHNLVKDIRLQFFKNSAARRPITNHIILVGPDHFSPYQRSISFADINWPLSNGQLSYDSSLGSQISSPSAVRNGVLTNDHAIYNLLPDIQSVWPQAEIVPILIGQQTSAIFVDQLVARVAAVCHSDCLVIASVDFSHYLPADFASIHDVYTLKQLNNQNFGGLLKSEVDSPQSLYLLAKFASLRTARHWNLFAHTNSGYLLRDLDIETTTHVFGAYNRSILPVVRDNSTTFVSTPALIRSQNQNSLGDRFFYGVDTFTVDRPDSTVIIGTVKDNQTTYYKFELTKKGNSYYFVRPNKYSDKLFYGNTFSANHQ